MSVVLATTTVFIEQATEPEPGEGRVFAPIAQDVRASIVRPAGSETVAGSGGGRQQLTATLLCDPVSTLDHTCRVTDQSTGEQFEVVWVKQRALIPHMKAGLVAWQGGGN